MPTVSKKRNRNKTVDQRQSKREYAVRYYAERDYRKSDAPGGVDPKELKKNWKHVVTYSLSEGELAEKLSTSVTYIRYLRRKVAICQKHGVTDPAQIYKLAGGVGEKTLKAYFESKGRSGKRNGVASRKKAAGKNSSAAKKSGKKSSKKNTAKKTAAKKAAKKKASKKTAGKRSGK